MKNKMIYLLLPLLLLTGCNQQTNTTTSISNGVVSNQVSEVEVTPTKVNIYQEQGTAYTTNSVEDAVAKVYDSVVIVNAYYSSSSGYSSGAGVIIADDNSGGYYVATCHHVIEDAISFKVTLSNDIVYDASLIGGDPYTDIAVLKITESTSKLTVSSFISNSDDIKLASTTIAIGNPLGTLGNTVTTGVVSSKSRLIQTSDGTYSELIQTDAAINSGNSGGGLFNTAGELIGIVSAKYAATGVEGLGFAIPANIVKEIVEDLILTYTGTSYGYVTGRYMLGLTITDGQYVEGFNRFYNVTYISSVDKNSSSYGYLQAKDILSSISVTYYDTSKESVKMDSITSASDVYAFLNSADLSIGDTLKFTIKRGSYSVKSEQIEVPIKQYIYSI